MKKKIKPEALTRSIQDELKLYSGNVMRGVLEESERAMDKLVEQTKENAPVGKRRKHYRNQIKSRLLKNTVFSVIYQWYVKGSDYRLSHLLNDGHALRNGGRYSGTQFITNAYNQVAKEYEQAVEKRIENGR